MALIVVALVATIVIQRQAVPASTATTSTVVHGTFPGALETSGFARSVARPGAYSRS